MLLNQQQFQRFSESLGMIHDLPIGEHPVETLLVALEHLLPIDSIAVDEIKGDGVRVVRHRHIAARRPELMELAAEIVPHISHDHPIIQYVFRHGPRPCLRMSDFVSQRELRGISLYAFNSRHHEWRDQAAVLAQVGNGTLSIALNRDRTFTDDEFTLLRLFQPHAQRVLAHCAWFVRLPGGEQLTHREREVLYWITQGKRDEEIACIIACAERTVRQHTRAILRKLGVENRATAISAVLSGRAHAAPAPSASAAGHSRRASAA